MAKNKDAATSITSWPDKLTVHHSTTSSIVYPDASHDKDDNNDGSTKFDITHIHAVNPSNKIVTKWEGIALKTILKLNKMSVNWAAVECFECKVDSNDHDAETPTTTTTLVITVYTMPSIKVSLANLIVDIHALAGCRVEMRAGSVGRHHAADTKPRNTYATDQPGCLSPGNRISFTEGLETPVEGTIGGIVELFDDLLGRKIRAALTCQSYLPPQKPAPPPLPPVDESTFFDPGPTRAPLEQYDIIRGAYPSQLIWQLNLEQICKDIKSAIRQITQIGKEIESSQDNMPQEKLDFLASRVSSFEYQARKLGKRLYYMLHEADCDIGTVCAFSGKRVTEKNGHRLDWALVELNEDVQAQLLGGDGMNTVMAHGQIRQPSEYEQNTLKPGSTVYKARAPEYSSGIVSATKSYVRFRQQGQGGKWIEAVEWVVVPEYGYSYSSSNRFSEPTDCGAWIVNRVTNELIGVIYAMNSATGVSYLTPIGEIFDDITRDTGFVIRLPGENLY